MTYSDKKSLGLILNAADRLEAQQIAAEIEREGGSAVRWDRADRTPAISAEVHNLITASPSCRTTPGAQLEQFRRFGEMGRARGARVWARPVKAVR